MSDVFQGSRRMTGTRTLLLAALFVTVLSATTLFADEASDWQPQHTRVFIVSLTRYSSSRLHSFSQDDRLDDQFAQLFRDRGVPANQVVLLKDEVANVQNIEKEFANFLRNSRPEETLIYYFGTHGSYDHRTGDYSYCAYNGDMSFSWIFNTVEREFRGVKAILLADSCFSGGIVELAKKRNSRISYACLSSTFCHQTAWSGWRFVQCLLRGLSGNPVVDLNGDGKVELDEFAAYTARYMAFAAENKPTFCVTGNFNPKLNLATVSGTKHPHVGDLIEVNSKSGWEKAEVIDSNEQRLKVHFTRDTRVAHDAWYTADHVRPFQFERFATGSIVDVKNASDDNWRTAKVLQNWESLYLCHRDGSTSDYDEWFGPYRIRKSISGAWTGRWRNSVDEVGAESLNLIQGQDERISGTWSASIAIKGEKIGSDVIYFEAGTPGRFYRCAGRVEGPHLLLNYVAHRTDTGGTYYGWATLGRQGENPDAVRDQHFQVDGNWSGPYENSQGGSGSDTLLITESGEKLQGSWSGIAVAGERLGNAMLFLEGTSGNTHYHVVGHNSGGRLILDYYATSGNEHYTGRSTLTRNNNKRKKFE